VDQIVLLTSGVIHCFSNTSPFGTSVLWHEIPALLLVSGRGIELAGLWLDSMNPEEMMELQGQPRLILE